MVGIGLIINSTPIDMENFVDDFYSVTRESDTALDKITIRFVGKLKHDDVAATYRSTWQ